MLECCHFCLVEQKYKRFHLVFPILSCSLSVGFNNPFIAAVYQEIFFWRNEKNTQPNLKKRAKIIPFRRKITRELIAKREAVSDFRSSALEPDSRSEFCPRPPEKFPCAPPSLARYTSERGYIRARRTLPRMQGPFKHK